MYPLATVIKRKENFPHLLGNSKRSGAKSYTTNDLLIYGENICAFPHILGSPSSYMTLQPNPFQNFLFSFLSVYSVCEKWNFSHFFPVCLSQIPFNTFDDLTITKPAP
jgi:hypothetical protein